MAVVDYEAWRNPLAVWAEAGDRANRNCRHAAGKLGKTCQDIHPRTLSKWCDNCLLRALIFHHDV